MKKKLVALLMAVLMTATTLTACGDKGTETGVSTPVSDMASDTADSDEGEVSAENSADGMVSDESFAVLQQNYETMIGYYNTVANTYNSDEIAANPDVENVMNQAADVITKMGEIQQDMLTEEDAVVLNDNIIGIVNWLITLAEAMEPADDAQAGDDAQAADGTAGNPASEETIAALQSEYASLVEIYNALATAYNNGEYEQNADFEAVMNEAAAVMEQIGAYPTEGMTEEEAQELSSTILSIIEQIGEFTGEAG